MTKYSFILAALFFLFMNPLAFAGAKQLLTVEGTVFDSAGTSPVIHTDVVFTAQIVAPGGCLLWQETFSSMDLSASKGGFVLSIGSANSAAGGLSWDKVFKNGIAIGGGLLSGCAGTYTGGVNDDRTLYLTFAANTPSVIASQQVPPIPIKANAQNAMISGIPFYGTPGTNEYMKFDGTNWITAPVSGSISSVTFQFSPAIFSSANVTADGTYTFTASSQGANTFYAGPTGGPGSPSFRTLSPADLTSALPTQAAHNTHFLQTDGAGNLSWVAGGGGAGDITDVLAGTGLTGGATTGSATLNVDVGLGIGKIPVSSAITSNQVVLGNSGGTQLTGTTLTSGQILIGTAASAPVAASLTGTANRIIVSPASGSITLSTPQDIHTTATPTFSGINLSTLKLTDGNQAAGKVLTSDASGNATWSSAGGGGSLSALTAATTGNTINNGANAQVWNWQLTSPGTAGMTFTENVFSSGGGTTQDLVKISTLASSTANPLHVKAQNADALLIDSNGKVGLGTALPKEQFVVHSTSTNGAAASVSTNGAGVSQQAMLNLFTYTNSAGSLAYGTATTTKGWQIFANGNANTTNPGTNGFGITYWDGTSWFNPISITSSGNVNIGTTTPYTNVLTVYTTTDPGTNAGDAVIMNEGTTSSARGASLQLLKTRSGSTVNVNDVIGEIKFSANNSISSARNFANIKTVATNVTSGSEAGNLQFMTANAGSLTTKMLIDPAGNVGVGTTTPQATIDINGTLRMKKWNASPGACTGANDGTMAMNMAYDTCICDGTSWKNHDGQACNWTCVHGKQTFTGNNTSWQVPNGCTEIKISSWGGAGGGGSSGTGGGGGYTYGQTTVSAGQFLSIAVGGGGSGNASGTGGNNGGGAGSSTDGGGGGGYSGVFLGTSQLGVVGSALVIAGGGGGGTNAGNGGGGGGSNGGFGTGMGSGGGGSPSSGGSQGMFASPGTQFTGGAGAIGGGGGGAGYYGGGGGGEMTMMKGGGGGGSGYTSGSVNSAQSNQSNSQNPASTVDASCGGNTAIGGNSTAAGTSGCVVISY